MLRKQSRAFLNNEMTKDISDVMHESDESNGIDLANELGMLTNSSQSFVGSSTLNSSMLLSESSQADAFNISHLLLPSEVAEIEEVVDEMKVDSSWDSLSPKHEPNSEVEGGSPDDRINLSEEAIINGQNKDEIMMYDSKNECVSIKLEDISTWDCTSRTNELKVKQEDTFRFEDYTEDICAITVGTFSDCKMVKEEDDCSRFAYNCSDCSATFGSPKTFKTHLEGHLRKLQNSCPLCDMEFNSKSYLQQHIREHFMRPPPLSCDICHEQFSAKMLLKKHKKQVHGNERNVGALKCKVCDASFSSRFSLKSHLSTHNSLKPYACLECGATFTQNGSLQVHLRRHTGEKPFKCDECGNKFTRAYSLKVHMKTHTGEKSYRCEDCQASFVTSSHLNVHRRTHTGERPYSCGECGATFITTSHLNVHRRHHMAHSLNLYESVCTICTASFSDPIQLRQHKKLAHKASPSLIAE